MKASARRLRRLVQRMARGRVEAWHSLHLLWVIEGERRKR